MGSQTLWLSKLSSQRHSLRRSKTARRRHPIIESLESRRLLAADLLYIGDSGNDSVQVYDATTGEHLSAFVSSGLAGLHGPRGMVIQGNELLVVNQNANTAFNGEVLSFNLQAPSTFSKLVDSSSDDAPFAPYGIVVKDNIAYVADARDDGISTSGRIAKYDLSTGTGVFVGDLLPTHFVDEFRPRGLVFGPDGKLYVSVSSKELYGSSDPPGYILSFDIATGVDQVVAWNNGNEVQQPLEGEAVGLHNPEGIVFGTDGKLYVTSNRVDVSTGIDDDTHILVLSADQGKQLKDISLNSNLPSKYLTRILAESIVFGPDGKLFIPIAQGTLTTDGFLNEWTVAGGVLKYDTLSGALTTFVTPSPYEDLVFPSYATFGLTDPSTLAYAPAVPIELPHSHVAELAQYSSKSFDVSWDVDPGQSESIAFEILVSTNGGAYVTWLANTTAHKGRFNGQDGVEYAFVSLARDSQGHVEPIPTTPDATTIARLYPWQNPVNRFDVEGFGLETRASDALRIINYLAIAGPDSLLPEPTASHQPGHGFGFYDVNGNGRASSLDALNVINELTRLSYATQASGEQVSGTEANGAGPNALESLTHSAQTSIVLALPPAAYALPTSLPFAEPTEFAETLTLVQPKRPIAIAIDGPHVDAIFGSESFSSTEGTANTESEMESLLWNLSEEQRMQFAD